jgi:hypothetical protein
MPPLRQLWARRLPRCERHGLADMYGFIPVDRRPGLWGGYVEYQYLAPDSMVLPVPAGLDPVVATLFNPLGAGIRWRITVPGTNPCDGVAVLGPGIRGLCAAAAAKHAGAGFVMVTGSGPRDADRLALAAQFGLLLDGLRPVRQPVVSGAGRSQLGTLLVITRRCAARLPVLVLLYGKIPYKPGMTFGQCCRLLNAGKQPKPTHNNNLGRTTDNQLKGRRRRRLPRLKPRVFTPQI